jgi:hypothetical protein
MPCPCRCRCRVLECELGGRRNFAELEGWSTGKLEGFVGYINKSDAHHRLSIEKLNQTVCHIY